MYHVRDNSQMLETYKLQNKDGAYIEVANYGATLVSVVVPDKDGKLENVVLSYEDINDYLTDQFYLGSTIGRVANRISNAQFMLDGRVYLLNKNDGLNSNHGGYTGFNKQYFSVEEKDDKLIFKYLSKDGEGGFPGNLQLMVTYSFSEYNVLTIEYNAVSDMRTVFNPTNHSYFNLASEKNNVLSHELKIYGEEYLESNKEFLPTGRIRSMDETGFDFRDFKRLGEIMLKKEEEIPGYNTYFISNSDEEIKLLASLKDEQSGRQVDVYSDMPGVQVYTGDYLSAPFKPHSGIAIEAQIFPDAPNHPNFPTCVIDANKEVKHLIKYKFTVIST